MTNSETGDVRNSSPCAEVLSVAGFSSLLRKFSHPGITFGIGRATPGNNLRDRNNPERVHQGCTLGDGITHGWEQTGITHGWEQTGITHGWEQTGITHGVTGGINPTV